MKILRTILSFILIVLLVSLYACNGNKNSNENTLKSGVFFGNRNDEKSFESISQNSKNETLVVFFSETGITEKYATVMSDYIISDLCKITMEEPYSENDLKEGEDKRTYIEQQKGDLRPEIKGIPSNINKYKYIFIGYPIWYKKAPRAILTFLNKYNFKNKTIIPFCTSSSDDIDITIDELKENAEGNPVWLTGKRFASRDLLDDAIAFVDSLNLDFLYDDIYLEDEGFYDEVETYMDEPEE